MAVVISNRGRLISDLTSVANLNNDDLFIIQSINASSNSTRKATITQLSNKVLGSLSSYSTNVKFISTGNEFTGAFYNPNNTISDLYALIIRDSLTISGVGTSATISPTNLTFSPVNGALFTKKIINTIGGITGSASTGFTGSLKGKLTGPVTGSVRGNVVGNLTGNVVGNVTGNLAGNVTGNVTGHITGDIYSPTSNLVLDNGTGVPKSARFYGTSSYATYAENLVGGVGISAIQAKSYVTTSMNSGGGVANTIPKFSDTSKLGLSSINDNGTSVSISTALIVATKISAAAFSGSFYGGPGGYKTQGTKSISFWGTGSHAVSASYLKNDSPNPLGILTQTSPSTVDSYKGSSYTFAVSSLPYYFRSVLVCVTNDTVGGYSQYVVGDEIESVAVYDSSGDNEHTAITSWYNSTNLGASFLNNGWLTNKKTDGSSGTVDPTKWKIKFYYK